MTVPALAAHVDPPSTALGPIVSLSNIIHSWPRSDLIAVAGIAVTIIIAIVPPLRRNVIRACQAAALRFGFPRRRYARWFSRTWGHYDNPYLDDVEHLDLLNTNVPLSFRSEHEGSERLQAAAAALADHNSENLIIQGAAGSGKTTLLKAFAVVALHNTNALSRRRAIVPFLIQLRKLPRDGGDRLQLSNYVVDNILCSGVGMKRDRAWRFFRYILNNERVMLMLDGLDEVTKDRYQAVHEAAYAFKSDHRPECPSYKARLIITCRRQNFRGIAEEWVPVIAQRTCTVAPLRDSDIYTYLDNLRPKFKSETGPESFLAAVRASGSLSLHRAPLVLAMSVGLYARKDYYEIPASISQLYSAMIEEMLDRHRFRHDPGGSALHFATRDKYQLLQQFAFASACGSSGFDEFTRADLLEFARRLVHNLDGAPDAALLTDEIITRSGLLSDVGEAGRYVFAHRSIQEFLAAQEVKASGEAKRLLERACDTEWSQVVQFYCADLDQRQVSPFLELLSRSNSELAGYCLATSRVSNEAAVTVLDSLRPLNSVHLAALASATMSPRLPVQMMAISRLEDALRDGTSLLSPLAGEVETTLPLLNSLAGTNAVRIAALVPELIANLPDDPRLVEPLWQCLTVSGIETLPASRVIVARLLVIAMSVDGFEHLARQAGYRPGFLAPYLISAYPFRDGLAPDHNLVSLLAWADFLGVTPSRLNRYFEAKAAGCLAQVEDDRKRTLSFSLFWPARAASVALSLGALAVAGVMGANQVAVIASRPLFVSVCLVTALIAPFILFYGLSRLSGGRSGAGRLERLAGLSEDPVDVAHIFEFVAYRVPSRLRAPVGLIGVAVIPLCLAAACLPLINVSTAWYLTVGLALGCAYWAPLLDVFSRHRRYYLHSATDYSDMYDDRQSRHWVR